MTAAPSMFIETVAKIERSGLQPAVLIDSDEILMYIIHRCGRIAFSRQPLIMW